MTNNESSNKKISAETKAGIGILAGAVAAVGLAAVYLYGTKAGQTHRKQLDKQLKGVKDDVVAELRKLQRVDKEVYMNVIDDVVSRYQQMDEVDVPSVLSFGKELKRHYSTIKQEAEQKEAAAVPKKPSTKKATTRSSKKKSKTQSSKKSSKNSSKKESSSTKAKKTSAKDSVENTSDGSESRESVSKKS
ncbi:MAG: hypothetical protein WDZ82_02160 [Candidatus Paceibacterota bacterium]